MNGSHLCDMQLREPFHVLSRLRQSSVEQTISGYREILPICETDVTRVFPKIPNTVIPSRTPDNYAKAGSHLASLALFPPLHQIYPRH